MYTFQINTGRVLRDADGVQVAPVDDSLHDKGHLAYLAWLDQGNQPTQVVVDLPRDPADVEREMAAAVQAQLDAAAQARGFDNIFTAATYAGSAVPRFNTDGTALRDWRDQCWAYCYGVLDAVIAGTRPAPSTEELLAGLPPLS